VCACGERSPVDGSTHCCSITLDVNVRPAAAVDVDVGDSIPENLMDGSDNVNTLLTDSSFPASELVPGANPMIQFSGSQSSSDESAQESDSGSENENEKEHPTIDSIFAHLRTVAPSNESPTPPPAFTPDNTDTESDGVDSQTENHPGVHDGALFDEMTKPSILSKDYAQAQLVDLCNNSGAPKDFYDNLVNTLKRLRKQLDFDPTKTPRRDKFFEKLAAQFPTSSPTTTYVAHGTTKSLPVCSFAFLE
jgi:hypothetical protein